MKTMMLAGALLLLISAGAMAQSGGDWVLGNWGGGGYWFPGVVQSHKGDKVTIVYDDGTHQTLPANRVRAYTWKRGTHVECRWAGGKAWYGGKITGISADGTQLDIKYDDGADERISTGGCRSR